MVRRLVRPEPASYRARGVTCCLVLGALAACTTAPVRREAPPRHEYPAGVAQMRWRTSIRTFPLSVSHPEECATGALVGRNLVLGSRAAKIVAVDVGTGAQAWATSISGGVDGDARYDAKRGQVLLGSDDGYLYAVRPESGAIRWSSKLKGAVDRGPEVDDHGIFVGTSADRVYALDPETGNPRWQYERDTPDGFTIHGYAVPHVSGQTVFAGFSDGYLTALRRDTGELLWSRSLAAASEEFVDVDASPIVRGDRLLAASFSGGVWALRPKDGEVLWHVLVDGASGLAMGATNLYVVSPREGLAAYSLEGNTLWRQGLPGAGDLTLPVEIGPYLVFSGSREGLFIVERSSGKLLQVFDPARGMCASPTVDVKGRALYVLANNGTLYALDLLW